MSAPASGVSTQSTYAFASGRFFAPFTIETAPTSKPVFAGTASETPGFLPFSVRMSWAQFGHPTYWPWETAPIAPGEVPM